MNLKTRFLLLIIGTFFIPNILIMAIVYLSFGSFDNMKTTHEHFKEYYHLSEYLNRKVVKEDFKQFLDGLPEYMNPRLMMPGETPPADIFNTLINNNMGPDVRKNTLEAMTVVYTDNTAGILIVNRPFIDKYSAFRNTPFPYIFPLALISVMTILSLLIIRSINSSLKKIEVATRRVAEGDFEFELTAKGSDSISSLTRSFDIMRCKVKEEYERRSRFFMGVSHDLKTPLASISGYADAVLEGYAGDTETLYKYMEIIRSKANFLQERITHLIHFVKLETGDWQATLEAVPLKSFLLEFSDSISVEAGLFKFRFESIIEVSENSMVALDRELVTRSLENLVHNAFRYSYPESLISLDVHEIDNIVTLSLINRSEGITGEELPNIFEPFYRGSKGRNEEGFGLGLANVAAVIKSHGWEIAVESELKKKTVFTIKIPIIKK